MSRERLLIAPAVAELLSDAQLDAVAAAVEGSQAECFHCNELIPESERAAVLLFVDPSSRGAAVRVCHAGCGESSVRQAAVGGPGPARLARRWAGFLLPGCPVLVLEAEASVWTDEEAPALVRMLQRLGFEPARAGLDSELFATGRGPAPTARGMRFTWNRERLELELAGGESLESFPGPLEPALLDAMERAGGALVIVASDLGIPLDEPLGLEEILPTLLDRAVGAFVPYASRPGHAGDREA